MKPVGQTACTTCLHRPKKHLGSANHAQKVLRIQKDYWPAHFHGYMSMTAMLNMLTVQMPAQSAIHQDVPLSEYWSDLKPTIGRSKIVESGD